MQLCPCCSTKLYNECCFPLHKREREASNPLELMRSRYCAYAFNLPDYIIETTHRNNPSYETNRLNWELAIDQFCRETTFLKLEILEHIQNLQEGYVTFQAFLERKSKDVSFQERSHFVYENSKWFYLNGTTKPIKK